MDRREAIENLEWLKCANKTYSNLTEALDLAIEALKADMLIDDYVEAATTTDEVVDFNNMISDCNRIRNLPPVTPTKRATETMIVDGEETEIDPVSYEIGYTRGQTAPIERTGEWRENERGVFCSACGNGFICSDTDVDEMKRELHFCPNCGAKMNKGGDTE